MKRLTRRESFNWLMIICFSIVFEVVRRVFFSHLVPFKIDQSLDIVISAILLLLGLAGVFVREVNHNFGFIIFISTAFAIGIFNLALMIVKPIPETAVFNCYCYAWFLSGNAIGFISVDVYHRLTKKQQPEA